MQIKNFNKPVFLRVSIIGTPLMFFNVKIYDLHSSNFLNNKSAFNAEVFYSQSAAYFLNLKYQTNR